MSEQMNDLLQQMEQCLNETLDQRFSALSRRFGRVEEELRSVKIVLAP